LIGKGIRQRFVLLKVSLGHIFSLGQLIKIMKQEQEPSRIVKLAEGFGILGQLNQTQLQELAVEAEKNRMAKLLKPNEPQK
jgi:hypothetical protein